MMFTRPARWTVVQLLMALALAALAFSGLARAASADEPAPDPDVAQYEIDFMIGMIDHHMMAVQMAEMCVDRAVHDELRAMCEQMIATQGEEIAQMESWLMDWYGIAYDPRMAHQDMRSMHSLMAVSSRAFEIRFMRQMIEHHQMAVMDAQECTERAWHDELVSMCENIIVTQQAEIAQMQQWLCSWYHVCRFDR